MTGPPPPAREAPAGVVLAAGAATRMGSPKALLRFGDRTALALAARALEGGGCAPVAVVLGAHREETVPPPGLLTVTHPGWESGRSGSLKAGLAAVASAPALVLLPVDHPLATAADVAALIGAWRETRPPVVRPTFEGRGGHPILLDAALFPEISALEDDEPLRTVVRRHREREVLVPGSAGIRMNVDTPEDYEAALALFRSR